MRAVVVAAVIVLASPAAAQSSLYPTQFAWPATDPQAIPDARLGDIISEARREADESAGQASEGRAAAGQARRLVAVRSAIGRAPQRVIVGDGVVMAAVPYGDAGGEMFGTLAYSSGAAFTGSVNSSIGEYSGAPESSISRFRGWVYANEPMTGVFEFKNGETFTGSILAGSNASGIYVSADGDHRFVGIVDFTGGAFRPVRGQVEDRRHHVLAVITQ